MKEPEYNEGPGALQKFKSLATAILQAKAKKKKKRAAKPASQKKQPKSDKD